MVLYLMLSFLVGGLFGFVIAICLTISKISSYEREIQKLKKKTIRFDVER